MAIIHVEVPEEVFALLGSADAVQNEAKEAIILNLVRRGEISRAKAAELLGIGLWDLPELLARYEIPWFHSHLDDIQSDAARLASER